MAQKITPGAEDLGQRTINMSAGRDDMFMKAAKKLSSCIHDLNLSKENNDKLIRLIIEQVLAAEHDAFVYASVFGIGLYDYTPGDKERFQ